jgi:prepilin-type N-terminal cleavage/methylation domain-containing protein
VDPRQTEAMIRQRSHPTKARSSESGFTFVEVIVALTLMAVAAGLLIGLEGAAVRRTIRDTQAQQAMLAARRIMSAIETMRNNEFTLSNQDNQPIAEVLQQLGSPSTDDPSENKALEMLSATVQVEDWVLPLPETESTPLKRISLKVSWGQEPDEAITILYLMSLQQGAQ